MPEVQIDEHQRQELTEIQESIATRGYREKTKNRIIRLFRTLMPDQAPNDVEMLLGIILGSEMTQKIFTTVINRVLATGAIDSSNIMDLMDGSLSSDEGNQIGDLLADDENADVLDLISRVDSGEGDQNELLDEAVSMMDKTSGLSRKERKERTRALRPQTFRHEGETIKRNDPCTCGSGKKYKRCCLRKNSKDQAS